MVLVHSLPLLHCTPSSLVGKHTPVGSQYLPDPHGSDVLQPPEHLVASAHWFDEHGVVVAVEHAPAPLQKVAVVAEPFEQLPGTHWTLFPGYAQALPFVPSQLLVHGGVPAHAARGRRGEPEIIRHLPRFMDSAQDSH
jgi:hypothetical protein